MQKINIICTGKIKEEYLRSAISEYLKRLSRFAKVEIKELPEGKSLRAEAEPVLRSARGYKIALCVEGENLSSESFAKKMKSLSDAGVEISFIIGSSCGLDDSVKESCDYKLSFSKMTFPHQLMRVILLEQVYRAFMINSGSEYHK